MLVTSRKPIKSYTYIIPTYPSHMQLILFTSITINDTMLQCLKLYLWHLCSYVCIAYVYPKSSYVAA